MGDNIELLGDKNRAQEVFQKVEVAVLGSPSLKVPMPVMVSVPTVDG